jgi:hypothetical protein
MCSNKRLRRCNCSNCSTSTCLIILLQGGFTGNSFCVSGVGPGTLTFDADNTNFTSGSIQYSDGNYNLHTGYSKQCCFLHLTLPTNPTTAGNHDYTIVSITNEFGCTTTSQDFERSTGKNYQKSVLPTTSPTAGTESNINCNSGSFIPWLAINPDCGNGVWRYS